VCDEKKVLTILVCRAYIGTASGNTMCPVTP